MAQQQQAVTLQQQLPVQAADELLAAEAMAQLNPNRMEEGGNFKKSNKKRKKNKKKTIKKYKKIHLKVHKKLKTIKLNKKFKNKTNRHTFKVKK